MMLQARRGWIAVYWENETIVTRPIEFFVLTDGVHGSSDIKAMVQSKMGFVSAKRETFLGLISPEQASDVARLKAHFKDEIEMVERTKGQHKWGKKE